MDRTKRWQDWWSRSTPSNLTKDSRSRDKDGPTSKLQSRHESAMRGGGPHSRPESTLRTLDSRRPESRPQLLDGRGPERRPDRPSRVTFAESLRGFGFDHEYWRARARQDLPYSAVPTNTIFRSKRDVQMASRQTQIDSMPPEERVRQEAWAQDFLKNTENCIAGYEWRPIEGGYICSGGNHMATHELIAEGMGRYYRLDQNKENWIGPI